MSAAYARRRFGVFQKASSSQTTSVRAVPVQPRRIARQSNDRAEPILPNDRALVVPHTDRLRQTFVPANEPRGRVEQPARLTIRRSGEQNLRTAATVDQLVQRERREHLRLSVLTRNDQHNRPPPVERLLPKPLLPRLEHQRLPLSERHDGILGAILDAALDCDDVERRPGLTVCRMHAAQTLLFAYEAPTTDARDVKALKLANPASWISTD